MSAPVTDPRVAVDEYTVRPTAYDRMNPNERLHWCLAVTDGHEWGWSVRHYAFRQEAMNRKGEFIWESRGSKANRFRRYPLEEALALALKHVDSVATRNGMTADQYADWYQARLAKEASA